MVQDGAEDEQAHNHKQQEQKWQERKEGPPPLTLIGMLPT